MRSKLSGCSVHPMLLFRRLAEVLAAAGGDSKRHGGGGQQSVCGVRQCTDLLLILSNAK